MATLERTGDDYGAITESCGLIDRSERGKLLLTGGDARTFLQGQVTNDVERLIPREGVYAAFLTPKGKMLGDLRVLASKDALWLDTERIALQPLFNLTHRFKLGFDVEVHKRTLERGLFSLVGPDSRHVAGASRLPDREHAHAAATLGEARVRLVVTDVGVDVIFDASDAPAVREALLGAGARPVADAVVETLRVERGRPRYGIDLDETTIPQEAGLNERAVSFTKGCYVGQETVARLHYRGKPNRHLRGLKLSEPAQSGEPVRLAERVVGRLGSVAISPRHGPIALALLRREVEPGMTVAVGETPQAAEAVALPFAA
jgi:folate-binding protein YgfZ